MSAFSDYLESGILNHILRGQTLSKPGHIAIALTSDVADDSDTGATIPEIPSGINGSGTGYARISLGAPSSSGDSQWTYSSDDYNAGSGVVRNTNNQLFNTALVDWGYVSGVAILDSPDYGSGNLLIKFQLDNPRQIFMGDSALFSAESLEINVK